MKKILVLAFMSFQMIMWSQNSSQVSDFVGFGNRSVGEFTGKFEKEFPLCQLSAHGLHLNIGLHYSSNGFQPNKDSGLVGYNWFLNTGGAIVRKVKGVEDELRDDRPKSTDPNDNFIDGFLVGVKKYSPNKDGMFDFNKQEINGQDEHELFFGPENDQYDGRPDEFSFNFHGISGRFFFDVDGLPKVITNNGAHFQIDVTGLEEQRAEEGEFDLCAPKHSEIIITADNGYRYYFGGHPRNLEWRIAVNSNEKRPVITAWNLRQVVAPNGKALTYEYADLNMELCELNADGFYSGSIAINVNPNESTTDSDIYYDSRFIDRYVYGPLTTNPSPYSTVVETFTLKRSKLNRINLAGLYSVNFNYEESDVDHNFEVYKNFQRFKLSSIVVDGINIPAKEVSLKYSYLGGSDYNRQFLQELQINDEDPYKFEYLVDNTTVFPAYNTANYDRSGYWYEGVESALNYFGVGARYGEWVNGKKVYKGTKFYRYINNNDLQTEEVAKSSLRERSKKGVGLLSKIVLPTGGNIQITYKESKVEEIKGSSEIGNIDFDLILSKLPISNGQLSNVFFEDDIDYISETIQHIVETKDHDYIIHKNANGTYVIKLYFKTDNVLETYRAEEEGINFPPIALKDYDDPPRLILSEILFDNEGKPISKTSYRYGELNVNTNYIVDAALVKLYSYPNGISNKISLTNYLLRQELHYSYNPEIDIPSILSHLWSTYNFDNPVPTIQASDITLLSQTNYTFDTYNKIKEVVTTGQSDLTTVETYTYVHDYKNVTAGQYNALYNENRLYPVSKTSYIEKGGVRYPANVSVTTYKTTQGNIVPDKQYQWTPEGASLVTQSGTNISSVGSVQVLDTENTTITSYDTYNNDGMAIEVSDNTDSYSYTLVDVINEGVIASFSHLTQAEFSSIPFSPTAAQLNNNMGGFSNYKEYLQNIFSLDRKLHKPGLNVTTFNAFTNLLRNTFSLSNNIDAIAWIQAKEFEYLRAYLAQHFPKTTANFSVKNEDGLVIQQIDVRGKSVYYEYDDKHRLIITKDQYGNIIKHYKYNY